MIGADVGPCSAHAQERIRTVHETVVRGNLSEVRQVLTRKRFALSRDRLGASPLHLAVLHGHTDILHYIVDRFPETLDGPDNVRGLDAYRSTSSPIKNIVSLHGNGGLYVIYEVTHRCAGLMLPLLSAGCANEWIDQFRKLISLDPAKCTVSALGCLCRKM